MIILAHGIFDVLHVGHINHLTEARKMGARLIVSITSDKWTAKGCIFNQEERATVLRALRYVDEVYICDEDTATPAILLYKPSVYVKGVDYVQGINVREVSACNKVGAQIRYTTTEKYSSSETVKEVFKRAIGA